MAQTSKPIYRSWVEVDLDRFRANLREVKRLVGPNVDFMQTVKADAYGHGAIEISHAALQEGARMLGVANADEGVQLRISGIEAPIVILGPSTEGEISDIVKYHLTPCVSNLAFPQALSAELSRAGRSLPVHLEVDTGMGRGGTLYTEAMDLIRCVMTLPGITLAGLFTHMAASELILESNDQQWNLFSELLAGLDAAGIRIPIRHMDNSGAVINYPGFALDMVRPGIMTYGIHPSDETLSKATLHPVMSFKTTVVLIKEFPAGCGIGYNSTYVTKGRTRVATIPVGYGDGYPFALSNTGEGLIRGLRAPIIGRVSMDLCTLDVTHIPHCEIGDEVVLLGDQGNDRITAAEVARKANTISYEVVCALGKRAPRVFVQKGENDAVAPRLRRVFMPGEEKSIARLDQIIRQSLQARSRDEQMGDAIYYEMFETLFGKDDRRLELRSGFRYDITLSREPQSGQATVCDAFLLRTHVSYRKVIRDHTLMIGCATDSAQMAALMDDDHCEYRWMLKSSDKNIACDDFIVEALRIDGEPIAITERKWTDRGLELWFASDALKSRIHTEVTIDIDIITRKSKDDKTFPVYLLYPTRGLDIHFNYGDAGLRNVRWESFFAGRHPRAEHTSIPGRSLEIRISEGEWIFPTSGVIFFWEE